MYRCFDSAVIVLLLALCAPLAGQQNPYLLMDINPGTPGSHFKKECSTIKGNTFFFTAHADQYGREIWMMDGSSNAITLLKDNNSGSGAGASFIHNNAGTLFITGDGGGTEGWELWASDGTAGGTALVKDILPGAEGSLPQQYAVLGGVTYFSAGERVNVYKVSRQNYRYLYRQLYRSDGTSLGTWMVKDLNSSTYGAQIYWLTSVNDLLYFGVHQSNYPPGFAGQYSGLGRSDGTANGTFILTNNKNAGENAGPGYGRDFFKALNATEVVFQLTNNALGSEPWITDGTTQGTSLLKDINPGSAGSNPSFFVRLGAYMYFTADDGVHGQELWRSDGTSGGTMMVADINSGSSSSSPQWLTPAGNALYFTANGGAEGRQLWKYVPGSNPALQRVAVINPSGDCEPLLHERHPQWSSIRSYEPEYPDGMFAVVVDEDGHTIHFVANDGRHGFELWQSDGTDQGTRMLRDVCVNCATSEVTHPKNVLNKVWFVQDDGSHGLEPWLFDPSKSLTYAYNRFPVAAFTATPSQGTDPLDVIFDATSSYDPDGSIASYSWNFGDGNYGSGVTPPTHTYQSPGTYTATLTVTDNENATSSASVTITVTSASAHVYVHAQSVTRVSKPGGRWAGRSVITIKDNASALVTGATVTASYSGPSSGTVSGTTASDGRVTLETASIKNPSGVWCFTVTDVVVSGHTFETGFAEVETCEGATPKGASLQIQTLALAQNYPNPFGTSTRIDFSLPREGHVNLKVYDLLGRELRTLIAAELPAGEHTAEFQVSNLPAGTYIYRLDAHGTRLVRTMQLTW